MSNIINIQVTEAEADLIMDLLHEAGVDRVDADGQPAIELCHDLMEQTACRGDLDPTDLGGRTFTIAAEDFIDHGMRAREMRKAEKMARGVSMAADRRSTRLAGSPSPLSEVQRHDVFDQTTEEHPAPVETSRTVCGNDPVDW